MYELSLTLGERRAIDWIGYRYGHGDDLRHMLIYSEWHCQDKDSLNPWEEEGIITFKCPEHIAWEIRRIGEEDNFLWTCFSPELAQKMNRFCKKIV